MDTFAGASHFTDSQLDRNLYKLLAEELAADVPPREFKDSDSPRDSALPRDSGFRDSRAPDSVPASQSPASPRRSRPSALDEAFDDSRDADSALSESTLENVSFVRDARRKAFWRRPLVRVVLLLVVLLLLALLGLQVAVHERARIAAMEPRARPLLQQLCAQLQCAVEPLRQIESVVIDSSSFTKLRPDTYRLSFTVKNNAPLPLAMPAIELALTDSADQPVLRRVLSAADLGAASPNLSPVLAAGGEWSGTFTLNVSVNSTRVVGYRLLAFYP